MEESGVSWWTSEWTSWANGCEDKWGEKSVISSHSDDLASLPRFTDQDKHVIEHCFHYTSTVLTSTLAFQKEQKLKCECQVSDPPGTSLRDQGAQLSAPEIHPQGKSPCLSTLAGGLLSECPGDLSKSEVTSSSGGPLVAGAVCGHPLVFNLGTTATSGWLEPEVNARLRLSRFLYTFTEVIPPTPSLSSQMT